MLDAFLSYMQHKADMHKAIGIHIQPKFTHDMYIQIFKRRQK